MKTTSFLFCFVFCWFSILYSQTWTAQQLEKANTAANVKEISSLEKEVIKYINLARLYPKDFIKFELQNYSGSARYSDDISKSKFKTSLINDLSKLEPLPALTFDLLPYENAKCLAKEQSKSGEVGHKRKKCKDEPCAECCSYGMDTGKDVVMQWLIDDNQPALGHRKICLGKRYAKIGVSSLPHKRWDFCSVADFQ